MINLKTLAQFGFLFCFLTLSATWADESYMEEDDVAYDSSDFSSFGIPIAGEISLDVDSWRGIPEGTWQNNFGVLGSINLGMPLPYLSCYDFGFQVGGSYGAYDWSGRGSSLNHQRNIQHQAFLTVGVFRRTPYCAGFNIGLATDWMFNKNFGVFALNPIISQLRWEGSYSFPCNSEFGLWGTLNTNTSHKSINEFPIAFRAISQVNLFWRHFYENCSQTMLWLGMPYQNGLMFRNRLPGKVILGASFKVPLTERLSIDGHAVYMHPRPPSGPAGSRTYASNVCFGITYAFFCGNTCDQCLDYTPYFPVANNSLFLTDSNFNF